MCEEGGDCVVNAERILIQPYSVRVELTRNLCSWKTDIPSIALAIQMGAFKVRSKPDSHYMHCFLFHVEAKCDYKCVVKGMRYELMAFLFIYLFTFFASPLMC